MEPERISFIAMLNRVFEKVLSNLGLKSVSDSKDGEVILYFNRSKKFEGPLSQVLKELREDIFSSSFDLYFRSQDIFDIYDEPPNIAHYSVFRSWFAIHTMMEMTLKGLICFLQSLGPTDGREKESCCFVIALSLICDQLFLLFGAKSVTKLSGGRMQVLLESGYTVKDKSIEAEGILLRCAYIVAFKLYKGLKSRMHILGEPGLLNQELFKFFMQKHCSFEQLIRNSILSLQTTPSLPVNPPAKRKSVADKG